MSGWITILCARCHRDSRFLKSLHQIRTGIWVGDCCKHHYPHLND